MPNIAHIICVEFDSEDLQNLSEIFRNEPVSLSTICHKTLNSWLKKIQHFEPALLLLTEKESLYQIDQLIGQCKSALSDVPIFALIDHENLPLAVSCMKNGAKNVISKSNIAQIKPALYEQFPNLGKSRLEQTISAKSLFHAQCILNLDQKGKVSPEFLNRDFLSLLPKNGSDQPKELNLTERVHPEDRESYNSFVAQFKTNHKPVSHCMRLVFDTQEPLWVTETFNIIARQNGDLKVEDVIENISKNDDVTHLSKKNNFYVKNILSPKLSEKLIHKTNDVILVLSHAGYMVYVNQAVTNHLEFLPNKLIGKKLVEIIAPEEKDRFTKLFSDIKDCEKGFPRFELKMLSASNETHTFDISANNFLTDPEINGIVFICRNITTRKKNDTLANQSNTLFQNLFYNSPEALCYTDTSGIIKEINSALANLFKYKRADLIEKPILFLLEASQKSTVEQSLKIIAKGIISSTQHYWQGIDSENHAFQMRVIATLFQDNQNRTLCLWTFSNIEQITLKLDELTQKKAKYEFLADQNFRELTETAQLLKKKESENRRKKDALDISYEKLLLTFEESPVCSIILSKSFQIISANLQIQRLLSRSSDYMNGCHIKEIIHPEAYEKFYEFISSNEATSRHELFETRLISSEGKTIWVKASIGTATNNDDAPGFVVQFLDISPQKTLLNSLKKQNARLEALAQFSKTFIDATDFSAALPEALKILSKTINADRAYLLSRKQSSQTNDVPLKLLVDYAEPNVMRYQDYLLKNPESIKKQVKTFETAFKDLLKLLQGGDHLEMITKDLTPKQQLVYKSYDVKSCVVFPLLIQDEFYGIIGFDFCKTCQQLASQDITLLKTATSTIGNAFGRYMATKFLEESRARYEILAKNFPNGVICLIDKNHKVQLIHAKDYFEKHPELSHYEGQSVNDLIPEKDAKPIISKIDETFSGNETKFEHEFMNYTWFIQTVPIANSRGEIDSIILIALDITSQKNAQNAILKLKEDYQGIFEHAHDAIFIYNTKFTKIIDANNQASKLYGYTKEEFKSLSPATLCKYPARGRSHIQDTLCKGHLNRFENVHINKHGHEINIEIHSSVIDYGGKKSILSICHDVTERNEIEQALRDSQRKYRQIIENTAEGIWILDKNANTTYVNNRLAELLGFTPEEMINTSFYDYIEPENLENRQNIFDENASGQYKRFDLKLVRQDGYFLWVIISPKAFYDDSQNMEGIHMLVTDITTRKVLEDTLRESEERYKTLAENFPYAASLIIDRNMRCILAAGSAFHKISATGRPTIEGKSLADVHPKELSLFFESHFKAAFNREKRSFETYYQNRNWLVHAVPNKTNDNQIKTISVICHDITEVKQQNKTFIERKIQFEHLFNQSLIGLLFLDCRGHIESVNPKLCQLLGYNAEELKGVQLEHISNPEDFKTETVLLRNLLAKQRKDYIITKRFIKKDGEQIWVTVHASGFGSKMHHSQCLMMIEFSSNLHLSH